MKYDPIETLMQEHEHITALLDKGIKLSQTVSIDPQGYESSMRELVRELVEYADKRHHHKEEEILFPAMVKKNNLLGDGIIAEMLSNHEDFRDMIRSILKSLDEKNYSRAAQQFGRYREALLDHIAVENEELFPAAATLFTQAELESMYYSFTG